jgi:tetratricopeptide (TPR) repeat protein
MNNLRNIINYFALCMAAMLCGTVALPQEKRVAILEPEGNEAVTQMNKKLVRSAIKEIISNTQIYQPIARNDASIDALLKKQNFQNSELYDNGMAKKLGDMLKADLICTVELHAENGDYLIDCDIVDVQSGENHNAGMVLLKNCTTASINASLGPKIYQMLGIDPATMPIVSEPITEVAYLVVAMAEGASSGSDDVDAGIEVALDSSDVFAAVMAEGSSNGSDAEGAGIEAALESTDAVAAEEPSSRSDAEEVSIAVATSIANFTRAVKHFEKGKLFFAREDYIAAVQEFTEAIRLNPKDYEYYYYRGNAFSDKGDHDSAIRDFDEAIRINPNNQLSYLRRARIYEWNKEDYDSAIRDYSEAIRIDPNNKINYMFRANLLFWDKEDYDSAIRDCSEVIRIDPNDGRAYNLRAQAHGAKGNKKSADNDYAKAKELGW